MKLTKVRVTEFKSVNDSTEFDIGDITCLVGKNEAGKTALLQALYRLNPILDVEGDFDVTDDYPRRAVSDYQDDVDAGRIEPAQVVRATYSLGPDDIAAVKEVFGPDCLKGKSPSVTIQKLDPLELTVLIIRKRHPVSAKELNHPVNVSGCILRRRFFTFTGSDLM